MPDWQWRGLVPRGADGRDQHAGKRRRAGPLPGPDQRGLRLDYALSYRPGSGARKERGKAALGTTGRGIGPAYEDKVARRALRVGDLADSKRLAGKLEEALDYYNFILAGYYHAETIDYQHALDELGQLGEQIRPMIADTSQRLHELYTQGKNILFEGAQGAGLDIDHGTYPFVTSSNTTAGGAATGAGFGPRRFDYVLGISKAYTTRVGAGPFPTELHGGIGQQIADTGQEFGATTRRPGAAAGLTRSRCGARPGSTASAVYVSPSSTCWTNWQASSSARAIK